MDVKTINKCLSKNVNNEGVSTSFEEYNIDIQNELSLNEGDYRTYIERSSDGICYVFTDEAVFLERDEQPIGEGPLYFSSVFFYSEGKDDYKEYKKSLPFSLEFEDSRDAIHRKLGKPDWFREDEGVLISERWDKEDKRIHIFYSTKEGTAEIISYEAI